MNESQLRTLLKQLAEKEVTLDEVVRQLKTLQEENLNFARIDHHRALRKGFPEVIYCEGKRPEQVVQIAEALAERNPKVLATRADAATFEAVKARLPEAQYNDMARTITIERGGGREGSPLEPTREGSPTSRSSGKNDPKSAPSEPTPRGPRILLLSAGTTDIPVAEEAAVTAEIMGSSVERLFDVGAAGVERLLRHSDKLSQYDVLIVVAGMDGVLPTVVSGLTDKPIIAVPTSVGYGSAFEGLAPLLTMLNSCAPGMVVVNIDNGFGAGYFASLLPRTSNPDAS